MSYRVLFLRNSRGITDVTGAETYLLTVMQGLARAGCTVSLDCGVDPARGDTPWRRALAASGLDHRLTPVPAPWSTADWRAARTAARAMGADLLHAMDHRSDVVATLLSRRLGIPAVASFFGWTNWPAGSWRARLYPVVDRLAMRGLARVIVDSDFLGRRLGVPVERRAVVPNGVDLARFDPERVRPGLKTRWFGDAGVALVGMVGRIHPNKGQHEFAAAAARLAPRFPELRFAVVGDPPPGYEGYRDALLRQVAELGLEGRFRVENVASAEIPDAIASFDVLAAPSFMESLSYVLLEAMALGVPVVTSRVGGHGELVTDGVDGLLVEPGDVDGLAAALARVLADPTLAAHLGASGRARVEQAYSTDAMIARTLAVYSEALGR